MRCGAAVLRGRRRAEKTRGWAVEGKGSRGCRRGGWAAVEVNGSRGCRRGKMAHGAAASRDAVHWLPHGKRSATCYVLREAVGGPDFRAIFDCSLAR